MWFAPLLGAGLRTTLALPAPALRRLSGAPRRSDRGNPLDLQMQTMLALAGRSGQPNPEELPLARARERMEVEARLADPARPAVTAVRDHAVDGAAGPLPARSYVPRASRDPLPILVFFHGGGFVLGSLDTHDVLCRHLAREADAIVVSVAYRLAPEEPFPAAFDDAAAAFEHVVRRAGAYGGRPDRVAIGGDSAGGNLAASVSRRQRDTHGPLPLAQLLIYPATDFTRSHASHRVFADGLLLDRSTMDWFVDSYLPNADDQRDPRASPLLAARLDRLPAALVVTAGFDPLRDEGEAYVDRLRDAEVPAGHRPEPTLAHGFASLGVVDAAARARRELGRAFGRLLRARLHR